MFVVLVPCACSEQDECLELVTCACAEQDECLWDWLLVHAQNKMNVCGTGYMCNVHAQNRMNVCGIVFLRMPRTG